jgi:predicted nucleic acid-binding protein
MNSSVVIDAGLAVFSVLNTSQSEMAASALEGLVHRGLQLCAPWLWWSEITSVLHRYCFDGLISEDMAYAALNLLAGDLTVQPVEVPARAAFDWATRLRQKPAYDGFYLVAAEKMSAELWTADRSLANNARQVGAGWVHWMGESG